MPDDKPSPSQVILYQTEDGRTRIETRFTGETAWLSLNQITELFQRDKSVISKHIKNIFDEGELKPEATVAKFATVQTEGERKVSRDIRSSEKVFWRKVLDIYATSIDYDPSAQVSQGFFATVQNKMHWAAHGQTAAEVIARRADASKPQMGLTRRGAVGGLEPT